MLERAALASVATDLSERPACPQCGGAVQARGKRKRRRAVPGDQVVELERTYAVCPQCGTGLSPPVEELGLGKCSSPPRDRSWWDRRRRRAPPKTAGAESRDLGNAAECASQSPSQRQVQHAGSPHAWATRVTRRAKQGQDEASPCVVCQDQLERTGPYGSARVRTPVPANDPERQECDTGQPGHHSPLRFPEQLRAGGAWCQHQR